MIYTWCLHIHIMCTHKQYSGRCVSVLGTERVTLGGGCLSGVTIISPFKKWEQELMSRAGGGGPQDTDVFELQGLYEKGKFKVEVNLKGNRKS